MPHAHTIPVGNTSAGQGLTKYRELQNEIGPVVSVTIDGYGMIMRNHQGVSYTFDHIHLGAAEYVLAYVTVILVMAGFITSAEGGINLVSLLFDKKVKNLELTKQPNGEIRIDAH